MCRRRGNGVADEPRLLRASGLPTLVPVAYSVTTNIQQDASARTALLTAFPAPFRIDSHRRVIGALLWRLSSILRGPLSTRDLCRWNRHNFACVENSKSFFSYIGTRRPNHPRISDAREVEKLIAAAKRHGQRDATLILVVVVADRVGPQSGTACPQGEEGKLADPTAAMNCACCASCSVGPARNCGRSGKLAALCREYVAWSRRHSLTPLEIIWENLVQHDATYCARDARDTAKAMAYEKRNTRTRALQYSARQRLRRPCAMLDLPRSSSQ